MSEKKEDNTSISNRQNSSTDGLRDEYTNAIGENGSWQMFLFVILAVPIKMVLPGMHFGIVFLAPKTTIRCIMRPNSTETVNMTCYNDCRKYEYFSEFESSIISQWDLVCDRDWLANFTQIMLMFGVLVGSVIFGFIADRHGRRPTLIISGILETCASFVLPFCTEYWIFVIVRFLLGAATAGTMLTAFVLLMEIFGPSKRELLGCIFMLPLSVGNLWTTVIAFYFRNLRDLSIGTAIPTLVFLTYVFCIPESPRWLISVGKLKEASVVMTKAARWNNLPPDNMLSKVEQIAKEEASNMNDSKASYVDLIRLSSLRLKNLCSCVIWFTVGLCLYGCIQYFGQTSSNTFLSFALMGIAQAPGILVSGYVSKIFGRRVSIIVFFISSSVGSGLLALPDDWYYVKLIAGAVGVGSGAAVFSVVYVYTPELFPTVARNMAMGTSSTANRVGSMVAPLIAGMHATGSWIPPAVFAAAPLAAVLAICYLPETRGKKLEDHLEQD